MLTRFGPQAGPTGNEVKAAWAPNDRTVIVIVDPSSPNILAFNTGQAVEQLLRRAFFIELQSRYGNKFFVRDEVPLCCQPVFSMLPGISLQWTEVSCLTLNCYIHSVDCLAQS